MDQIDILNKIGVKVYFLMDNDSFHADEFKPVMNNWIKMAEIRDHLLIDIADYSHVFAGPGIILVSHEANISLDNTGQRPGLLYQRKQPIKGNFTHSFKTILRYLLQIAEKLKTDFETYPLKFQEKRVRIIFNDRLFTANTFPKQKKISDKLLDFLSNELNLEIDDIIFSGGNNDRLELEIIFKSGLFKIEWKKLGLAESCS